MRIFTGSSVIDETRSQEEWEILEGILRETTLYFQRAAWTRFQYYDRMGLI